MKRENMKVGMKVVVKPNAWGFLSTKVGQVITLDKPATYSESFYEFHCPVMGICAVDPKEVRKATQEEITASLLSSMTTPELQQLLDSIDVELDKRLTAVHPDARYMFRECVVDGHTCYVRGFGDYGSKESGGFLLIEGHPDGCHFGNSSFLGGWSGRKDLTWKAKSLVKLVNEDGGLEGVV